MSGVRVNETEQFAFDYVGWYLFIDRNLNYRTFTSTVSSKKELVRMLDEFIFAKLPFKLFGVWHGEWRTDLFLLDPVIAMKRLREEIDKRGNEKTTHRKRYKK